jgi:hypothetical protein
MSSKLCVHLLKSMASLDFHKIDKHPDLAGIIDSLKKKIICPMVLKVRQVVEGVDSPPLSAQSGHHPLSLSYLSLSCDKGSRRSDGTFCCIFRSATSVAETCARVTGRPIDDRQRSSS